MARRFSALLALTLAWLHSACSLDERTLTLAASDGGGSNHGGSAVQAPTGEAGTTAGRGGGAQGGQAGQAGDAEGGQAGEGDGGAATFEDGCTDLNHNGVSDCTETLLLNSSFTSDVDEWKTETGATITWDPLDLMGVAASGSALVTSTGALDAPGISLVAAAQCVQVEPGKTLEIYAQARTESGPVDGNAAISLWFFPTAGCGDSPSTVYQTDPLQTGQTVLLQGSKVVPDSMVSVRVRLGVIKPFMAESFSVRFDNLLIDAH
ncbi:MAG TPA: hypothetical protein VHM25_08905 [Polyangiaceae bacterium]|nr:hypothetical protein [Polyangiaceae bacterium]